MLILKLNVATQKWTMNQELFLLKTRGSKKFCSWRCIDQERKEQWIKRWFPPKYELCWKCMETSCIYQERNEQWMKRWFSLKYELCWKSIETEAVFTKREMNNEWNVDFLENTSCVEKVSRLKLYLPERNEQWMKRWFSWKYELCWKSIEHSLLSNWFTEVLHQVFAIGYYTILATRYILWKQCDRSEDKKTLFHAFDDVFVAKKNVCRLLITGWQSIFWIMTLIKPRFRWDLQGNMSKSITFFLPYIWGKRF